MPYTPNNNPYIPGDPYSYDLKWLVQKTKDAASTATTAKTTADTALSTANSALSAANGASNNASTALNTANNAANDATTALTAITNMYNTTSISSSALINSDNLTNAVIIDGGGTLMGRLLLFRIIFRANGTYAYIPFKSPYKIVSTTPAQIWYQSNPSYPPDTFVGLSNYTNPTGFMLYQLTSGELYTFTGVVLVDPEA